jgi:hypothetical protein
VADGIAAGSLATQQRHDLVSAHARHVPAGGRVAQPPDQPLPPALSSLGADYLKHAADLDDLNLIAGMQSVLGSQMRRDGQLALATVARRGRGGATSEGPRRGLKLPG